MSRLRLARTLARQRSEVWTAIGCGVFDPLRVRVLLCRDASTARYIAEIHNTFLPLVNGFLELQKMLEDRAAIAERRLPLLAIALDPSEPCRG